MTDHHFTTLMGERGLVAVNASSGTVTGDFYGVYFAKTGAIATIECNVDNSAALVGEEFSAGTLIPCIISSISVASGTVLLLKR